MVTIFPTFINRSDVPNLINTFGMFGNDLPGGKPTYIRFTKTQLDLMDSAVVARKFLNRSEFARDAVEKLLSTTNPATNAR